MAKQIETLLLVALPASGKSEVRTYLSTMTETQCREEFHFGSTVQLDDFPYVHFMRRIDEELEKMNQPTLFFDSQERPFRDPIEWGTLIELINEDYADLIKSEAVSPPSAAKHLFDRLERARARVDGPAKLSTLPDAIVSDLAARLEQEAAKMLSDKHAEYPDTLEGKTVVIEFARGGPQGASFPLQAPFGYEYAFSCLSDEILQRATVLYIWVTPEESRRKNDARADPDDPGSILHHGVPIEVMLKDYGCDDIDYLLELSSVDDAVEVKTRGKQYCLPLARFDNREDKTSFIRDIPQAQWPEAARKSLHDELKRALKTLGAQL